jgi:hypothetical protein
MVNKVIEKFARQELKDALLGLNSSSINIFKQMYYPTDLSMSTDYIVDNMPADTLDWALTQVHKTLDKQALSEGKYNGLQL